MNTPAHVIVNLVLVPNKSRQGAIFIAIVFGALLPDLPMFGFYAYEKFMGVNEATIWREHYYDPRWQSFFDTFNSIPFIVLGLLGAYAVRSKILAAVLLSMLIHTLGDLPVHHDDGHRHFFPLSDWRFDSPVSYWDPNHYGVYFGVFEFLLTLFGAIWLYRNYAGAMRIGAAIVGVVYCLFMVAAIVHWGGVL